MTLDQLIAELSKHDPATLLPNGFGNPHSYRGYYDELAFEPMPDRTIGQMLAAAQSAVGSTYPGWKGGDFTMSGWTDCHLAHQGDTGEDLSLATLTAMIEVPTLRAERDAALDRLARIAELRDVWLPKTSSDIGGHEFEQGEALADIIGYPDGYFVDVDPEGGV